MKSLPLLLATLLWVGCAAPAERTSQAGGLITLDSAESQLAAAFNRNSDDAQLVVILSPT